MYSILTHDVLSYVNKQYNIIHVNLYILSSAISHTSSGSQLYATTCFLYSGNQATDNIYKHLSSTP